MTREEKNKILKDFAKNFIQKERQERCYAQLTSSQKRGKFSDRLNHNWDSILNMKHLTLLENDFDYPEKIQKELGFKDNELCYVISNYQDYDDKLLSFKEIFAEIYSRGFATILMNISANTLFLETERLGKYGARFIGKVVNR